MTRPLIVVGAGGFGRETLDVVAAVNRAASRPVFELLGVVDSSPSEENLARLAAGDIPYLGTIAEWLEGGNRAEYLIGVGSPGARDRLATSFHSAGLIAATVIHPAATVGSQTQIDAGSIICAGVQISTGVALGKHVHLNPNSTIGHDSTLRDFVSINPAATISGAVTVGSRTLVGAAAVVLQNLTVGEDVVVGASACVVRDVVDGAVVKGVPAR